MPAAQKVVITGLKSIDKRLRLLPLKVQKKVARQAMRSGLKVMAAAVKAESPVDTGVMKKAVQLRAVKSRKRGSIELEVRIKADDKTKRATKKGQTVFYPAIVEYGKKGTPPNAFMRRAFEATGERARKTTIAALKAGILSEAGKG